MAYFEAQLRNIKAFLPVDLYDSISSTPIAAIRVAIRDLKKDLGHLRRRGVDPSTFLGGALVRIARSVEAVVA